MMISNKITLLALTTALLLNGALGFAPTLVSSSKVATTTVTTPTTTTTTALNMANDEDLLRWARSSRTAGADDNLVELVRPIGVVLAEDEKGNVFVETLAPNGNAARSGKVKEGDIITMCSATFGEEMWSTRGVGLSRVLAAIRLRAGATVKLVFESQDKYQKKAVMTTKQKEAMEEARKAAQAKKDSLLAELEQDEKKLKKGKFLGLF